MTTVGDIAAAVEALAPRHLAEDWDNVGLLVGDPAAPVRRVLSAYDLTAATLDEAARREAEAVVLFHPPIFKPLARVRADEPAGAGVHRAIREGRSLLVTHTALDQASPGTSDFLAEALGLEVRGVLRERVGGEVKVIVFCPPDVVDEVAAAMAAAGAGVIGEYRECSFRIPGQGTFRGLEGTDPAVGESGRFEQVDEIRLEMITPKTVLAGVLRAMVEAHPYEEVAYDLVPLLNSVSKQGMGRLAQAEPTTLGAFAVKVGEVTGARHLRWVGDPERRVAKVALVGGSGASFVMEAARAGADVLVTGDVKHHDALLAERLGMGLVDPGHWATERFVVGRTAAFLAERLPEVTVVASELDGEPFNQPGAR